MSGAAAVAAQYTRRFELQAGRPGYTSWKAWILLLHSLGICAVLHAVMVFVSVRFWPVPVLVVLWAPVVAGVLGGYVSFSKSANIGIPKLPIWVAAAGTATCVLLTVLPTLLARDTYDRKVRRALHAQVSALLRPPHLPETAPDCISVHVNRTAQRRSSVTAHLSDQQQYDLNADIDVFKATLVRDAASEGLLGRLAEVEVQEALKRCIAGYPHLAERALKAIRITKVVEPGIYAGETEIERGPTLAFTASARPRTMLCTLEATSHIRAAAMPQATALGQRVEPGSDAVCVDVTLAKASSENVWAKARATLSNDTQLPIIVTATPSNDAPARVNAFLQFREAAIIEINATVAKIRREQGLELSPRCINIKDERTLRANEITLKAIFPETELWVLVERVGYEIHKVVRDEYTVMLPARRTVQNSWSLLLPAHYARTETKTPGVSRTSTQDMLMLTLLDNELNTLANFSLRDYASRERDEWVAGHPAMQVGELESFETRSGLEGYRYTTRHGSALRMKYFFVKASHLAIITGVSNNEAEHTAAAADSIVASLRYADVFNERADSR